MALRDVVYGPHERNRLDVFTPASTTAARLANAGFYPRRLLAAALQGRLGVIAAPFIANGMAAGDLATLCPQTTIRAASPTRLNGDQLCGKAAGGLSVNRDRLALAGTLLAVTSRRGA